MPGSACGALVNHEPLAATTRRQFGGSSGAWHQADGDLRGVRTYDRVDQRRSVPVVLRVIGLVDGCIHAGGWLGEGRVTLQTASADAACAAGFRAPVPGIGRPEGRAHIQVIPDPDDPDGDVRPHGAVRPRRCDLQLVGLPNPAQLITGPSGHVWLPSFQRCCARMTLTISPSDQPEGGTVRT